jgi:Flp pilus assembly protein TadG
MSGSADYNVLAPSPGCGRTIASHTAISTQGKIRLLLESSGEAGQALLEFAMCLPVLLLVVTGIFTFGIFMNHYLILTNAVALAAQQLAVSRGQTTDPCLIVSSTVTATSPILSAASLSYNIVLNGVSFKTASCSSSSTSTGSAADLVQGTAATVTVSYPCSLSVYTANFAPNCLLKAQTTELIQ